ncbi:MAG: heme ABC exporter ATP-binding protein CcmA [Acetobacteraceae bacterium]
MRGWEEAGVFEAQELAGERGGRLVFAGVSFRLAPGGALLLVGANGAGKTSLLRVLAGLGRIAGGTLRWDGAPIGDDPQAHAARLALLGHLDALKPPLTVAETLAHEARLHGGAAAAAIAALALEPLAGTPVRALSAGQRRRVALARLLLGNRPLWLLDEPTVALDAEGVALLGHVLASHRAGGGLVVASSHLDLPLPGADVLRLAA